MKLKKQVTVCGAAIFCVAVFSLYLMLDRVQHDPARHQNGGNFPRVSQFWLLTSACIKYPGSGYCPSWRVMAAQVNRQIFQKAVGNDGKKERREEKWHWVLLLCLPEFLADIPRGLLLSRPLSPGAVLVSTVLQVGNTIVENRHGR